MALTGEVNEITDINGFVASYLIDPKNPDPSTFSPLADAKIVLSYNPPGSLPSFIPNFSIKTKSQPNGRFLINERKDLKWPTHLIVYKLVDHLDVPHVGTIPIYNPVYRSESFHLGDAPNDRYPNGDLGKIFFLTNSVSAEMGLSQEELSEIISESKDKLEVDFLNATIKRRRIAVRGKKGGAELEFDLKLKPYTGPDLSRYLRHSLENYDLDLPGPDFLLKICINEDEIESEVRSGVKRMIDKLNPKIQMAIIDGIARETQTDTSLVEGLFDSIVSLTIASVRYPIISTFSSEADFDNFPHIPGRTPRHPIRISVDLRAIAPVICIGLPRQIRPTYMTN